MILVSWYGANAYSLWANQRDWGEYRGHDTTATSSYLPSEAQWEYAARGPNWHLYPWGNSSPTPETMNAAQHRIRDSYSSSELPLQPVHREMAQSPFGLQQMAGNVWQWCRDWYDPAFYDTPESRFVLSVREGGLVGDSTRAAVRQRLFNAVLDDGRGLRALFPRLTSVRLATTVEPEDSTAMVFIANADCRLMSCGKGPDAHLQVAKLWAQSGMADAARQHLAEAEALYPGIVARSAEAGLAP